MKVLPSARILLVDSDSDRRQATRAALVALGVGVVHESAAVEDGLASPGLASIDVLVLHATDAENVPEHPGRDGIVPGVLVLDAPAPALARIAAVTGYDAAVGLPLLPRLLYRRIGSVMQRSRRSNRPSLSTPAETAAKSELSSAV